MVAGQPDGRAAVSILIVEDDRDIRELVCEIFESEGYSVATAADGAQALEFLRTTLPKLILVDLNMPVMNGAEFNAVRVQDPVLRAIPTVVMTAADRAYERSGTLEVWGVIWKPVALDVLLALAARYCRD
jgi:CheY-like chemotaxis protein